MQALKDHHDLSWSTQKWQYPRHLWPAFGANSEKGPTLLQNRSLKSPDSTWKSFFTLFTTYFSTKYLEQNCVVQALNFLPLTAHLRLPECWICPWLCCLGLLAPLEDPPSDPSLPLFVTPATTCHQLLKYYVCCSIPRRNCEGQDKQKNTDTVQLLTFSIAVLFLFCFFP